MNDIVKNFERLNRETCGLIRTLFNKQDGATCWLYDYMQHAKDVLNQNSCQVDAIAETPKRASKGSISKTVRVLSNTGSNSIAVIQTPLPSSVRKSSKRSIAASDSDVPDGNCAKHRNISKLQAESVECLEESNNGNKTFFVSPAVKATPDIKKDGARKSINFSQNQLQGSPKVLVVTKASKHRNSLNRSVVALSSSKPVRKSRRLRQTCEKQEREEAVVKKQALLKLRVEEQKKKRELKMERNLRARQQIEQETEQRLKKISVLYKEEKTLQNVKDKMKQNNVPKNKKRKQTDCSDSEKPNALPVVKVIKVAPSKPEAKIDVPPKVETAKSLKKDPVNSVKNGGLNTPKITPPNILKLNSENVKKVEEAKSAPASLKVPENQPALNSTYVAENKENSESYTMTPRPEEMSYTNYDMSELHPSDDDDDVPTSKPIPSWAMGIRFKEALIKQHYHPPDLEELFPPIEIRTDDDFGMRRMKKIPRTSSAVWNLTPLRHY